MIKKETLIYYAASEDDRVALSKIYDSYLRACDRNYNTYSDFISEEKKDLLEKIFAADNEIDFKTYGGYKGAERVISAFLTNDKDLDFPIECIEISSKNISSLSHRDILGALMGLGIKRETVGDILIDKTCLVFVKREIADYIILNLLKAGRYPVSCDYYKGEEIERNEKSEVISSTVSSVRLDAVISSGFKIKRSDAVKLINQGRVSVSHKIASNPDMKLKENDRITLRGYGKIIYLGEYGTSKKGRTIINIKKF